MTPHLERVNVDGLDILIETTVVPGSERTSSVDKAGQKIVDGFDGARETIVALATRAGDMMQQLGRRAINPKEVQIEFGLAFGTNGSIILVGTSVEASLKVTLTYDRPDPDSIKTQTP